VSHPPRQIHHRVAEMADLDIDHGHLSLPSWWN
jgi:hypothetical protein